MAEVKVKKGGGTKRRVTRPAVRRAAKLGSEMAIVIRNSARSRSRTTDQAADVAVVRVLNGASRAGSVELVPGTGRRFKVPREQWEEVRGDLKTLVRDELAPLDAQAREAVLDSLAESTALDGRGSFELSSSLYSIREVLRERLPRGAVSEDHPAGLAVEEVLAVDECSFWINGWMHDADGLGEVTVVSPEGACVVVNGDAHRHQRPDVVQFYSGLGIEGSRDHGFTVLVVLPGPSLLSSGWIAELRTADGTQLEIQCPEVVRDPQIVRSTILGELDNYQREISGPLTANHGHRALERLQMRIVAESEINSVDTYGKPPTNPKLSIVIPLYKRIDFIEHQLLQFCRDPDFEEVELVYVLDSSEQADALAGQAHDLFALYGLPFRVVNLSSAGGFAAANNHGIEVSKGKRLLLLNSDVIPDRPGWMSAMSEFYDQTPGIGALGPKLLYEDGSLQHAGLYFHRAAGSQIWENAHCFKGLHRTLAAANIARTVPAVTAACMMIDREAYEQVGGLPLHYVQGDYEDSELCIRLWEAGRTSWYLPSVELFHLEGQSYLPGVRRIPSEYNMWLHSHLHRQRIEELMADFDPHLTAQADRREA